MAQSFHIHLRDGVHLCDQDDNWSSQISTTCGLAGEDPLILPRCATKVLKLEKQNSRHDLSIAPSLRRKDDTVHIGGCSIVSKVPSTRVSFRPSNAGCIK